jgi:hypothetical protein
MMAKTIKSTLTGIWLMQVIQLSVPVPCRIEYTVRHKGEGNNDLRVRCGIFWHMVWGQVHDFEIERGKSASRKTELANDTTGSDDARQDFRWRLSRAVLTKEIPWELTYTITRLSDEADVTHECDPTITSEKG